jgi:hypothetical protein
MGGIDKPKEMRWATFEHSLLHASFPAGSRL